MAYDIYPAVDENYNFPPEIRKALVKTEEFKLPLDARPTLTFLANRGILKKFATLEALFSDTDLTDGDIATVSRYSFYAGVYHNYSAWQKTNGRWCVLGGIIMVEATTTSNVREAAKAIIGLVVSRNNASVITPGVRFKNVTGSGEEFRWDGNRIIPRPGFLMIRGWSQWNWGTFTKGGWTQPPMDVYQDTYAILRTQDNGFTAPARGKYRVSGKFGFQQDIVNERVIVAVKSNSGAEWWSALPTYQFGNTGYPFSILFDSDADIIWNFSVFYSGTRDLYHIAGGPNNTKYAPNSEYSVEFLGVGYDN